MVSKYVKDQIENAKAAFDAAEEILDTGNCVNKSDAIATLAAAILISAQLKNLAENVDVRPIQNIADAITAK